MFKHELGKNALAKSINLRGVLTARSENLYGCNRYYVQPPAGSDQKVPDGWWVDEDDLSMLEGGIERPEPTEARGGPVSRRC